MRVVEQYGMFTAEGDALVDRIVRAGLKLGQLDYADNATIWKFVQRELRKLAATEDFAEATDTVVREEVFNALWNTLPGFNVSEEVYYG
jgi:hypothetical protein